MEIEIIKDSKAYRCSIEIIDAINFFLPQFSVKTAEAFSVRKHAHEVYRDFVRSKHLKISLKHLDIFIIVTQNIHCGYTLEPPRSNEYPKYMFWNKNKKNRHTPAYPCFAI